MLRDKIMIPNCLICLLWLAGTVIFYDWVDWLFRLFSPTPLVFHFWPQSRFIPHAFCYDCAGKPHNEFEWKPGRCVWVSIVNSSRF